MKIQERVDGGIESNIERVDSNSSVGLRVDFSTCK